MTLTVRPRRQGALVSQATVDQLAEYAVANPATKISAIAEQFGLSTSVIGTWLHGTARQRPSRRLAQWLSQADNLQRWQTARPSQVIGSRMTDQILEYQIANEATSAAITDAAPPPSEDSASLRDTVASIQAQAQVIDREAQAVLSALDLIAAWTNTEGRLVATTYEVTRLTDQLRLAQRTIDEYKCAAQQRNLAVHSRD
jgi:hypothetical protein